MDKDKSFPNVLLLGNGLNRAYGADNWEKLLEKIHKNPRDSYEELKKLPFPLQAVLATNDQLGNILKEDVLKCQGLVDISPIREQMEKLLSIPFDHVLTTNYTYEIERVANSKVKQDGEYCKNLIRSMNKKEKAEPKYMLHSYNEVAFNGHIHKVWHIHGENRKPQSLILGHYAYGTLMYRYQKELSLRGNKQYEREKEGKPPIINSWLDAFIMGNVYVLGFGFDFSEMDMWWLLNRKKREKAKHGDIIFYFPVKGNEIKLSLLEAYGARIESVGFYSDVADYKEFYKAAVENIRKDIMG